MSKGFSLIELLIVLTILVIVASAVIRAYENYSQKLRIENETHKIYLLLKEVQLEAKTKKENRCVKLNPNPGDRIEIYNSTCGSLSNKLRTVKLEVIFEQRGGIGINKFGIVADMGNIHIKDPSFSASINCVKADRFRICEGEWNGSECRCKF
ncbi:MAG: hypothetical protein DSZ31_00900 [Gammaproteobacteria bacterium]|nr:MAG: hypothetical protein DSZ31_00900 [Gammaproteobacteria bacterium]